MRYYNYTMQEDSSNAVESEYSYVRFLHAMPGIANIDAYINDEPVVKNAAYKEFTQYFKALPGLYKIRVFEVGTRTKPIFESAVEIMPNKIYTVSAVTNGTKQSLSVVADTPGAVKANTVYMRVIQYSPDTTELDVYFNNHLKEPYMEYGQVTDYFELSPGAYTIKVNRAGASDTVLTVPNIKLKGGRFYAAYIVGLENGRPGLQILLPLEGASYLKL